MKKDKNIELIGDIHFNANRSKWKLDFWQREFSGREVQEKMSKTKAKYFDNKQEAIDFAKNNSIKLKNDRI